MPSNGRGKRGGNGHGGSRQGTPGVAYTNRSDLNQAPRAATNQPYGQAGAQLAAQRAVPLPGPGRSLPQPVPLTAPTGRPNEPLTSGIPSGPGPGPETLLGAPNPDDNAEGLLRAIALQYPNTDVARLLATLDARRT